MTDRLPLTVVGGYLGAGKTTLINRLLRDPGGRRIMVLVNDFGAINIDAELLESADGETLALTNGCVCCTMGGDLFMALGDALDRRPRPDHLVVEASGVADPARIAEAARAEPEMAYAGVVVVVDGENFPMLAEDAQIGAQLQGQVRVADLVLVSKRQDPALMARLGLMTRAPVLPLADDTPVAELLLAEPDGSAPRGAAAAAHPVHVGWSASGGAAMARDTLEARVERRPAGLYRLKGFVAAAGGGHFAVQAVGQKHEIRHRPEDRETELVGIGLVGRVTTAEVDAWWSGSGD